MMQANLRTRLEGNTLVSSTGKLQEFEKGKFQNV